jgi:ADP-heptose:LPS heptosyltransferase
MNSGKKLTLKSGRELFLYYHGIGDSLLFNTVLYHLGRDRHRTFLVGSAYPEIFAGNPYVKHLPFKSQAVVYKLARILRWLRIIDGYTHMDYYHAGRIPQKHIMQLLAERVGLKQTPERPLMFLSEEELAQKILPASDKPWIALQSVGNSSWTDNKNWGADKFVKVADLLLPDFALVQLGDVGDPSLPVQVNLCGQITVRQVFLVLSQCAGFAGLEGFLMHAATVMEVPSVIVYGGFSAPWQTGYEVNVNLYNQVPCAPCWLESKCPYDKKCMEEITPEQVCLELIARVQATKCKPASLPQRATT